jgi:hypothetical protein
VGIQSAGRAFEVVTSGTGFPIMEGVQADSRIADSRKHIMGLLFFNDIG